MVIDIHSKEYKTALNRGYLYGYIHQVPGWEQTFVAQWIKKYPQLCKVLDLICASIGKDSPMWEDFTESNIKSIRDNICASVSANSARTYFASIKSILNDMRFEAEIPCKRYDEILKQKKCAVQNIYLTAQEVKELEKVIPNNKREQYVKCLFLISVYTGCRHSDALELDLCNIADNYCSYVSQKTSVEAIIPCHYNLINCIESYDRNIKMYDDEYNNIIRSLCKRAEINAPVKVVRAGETKKGEKWQFAASHTARRTFASLLYLKGVDVPAIGRMMGHSGDLKMTMRYICSERSLSDSAMSYFQS